MSDEEMDAYVKIVLESLAGARAKVTAGFGREARAAVCADIEDLNVLRSRLSPTDWYALDLITPESHNRNAWRAVASDIREASKERSEAAFALGQLRHLYMQMVNGLVHNTKEAATGLLGPAISRLEVMLTPRDRQ